MDSKHSIVDHFIFNKHKSENKFFKNVVIHLVFNYITLPPLTLWSYITTKYKVKYGGRVLVSIIVAYILTFSVDTARGCEGISFICSCYSILQRGFWQV